MGVKERISDEAVKAKTGKTWEAWFKILDKADATKMTHTEIAALLYDKFKCPPWWSQMVANQFEQERGLRKKHEMFDGYQISVSKTIQIQLSRIFSFCSNPKSRGGWLGESIEPSTVNKNKNIRSLWTDGKSRIEFAFYDKDGSKCQLVIQHNKIPDAKTAQKMKAYWKKKIEDLVGLL